MLMRDDVNTPVLGLLQNNGTMKIQEFTGPIEDHFEFANDEVNESYRAGIETLSASF